MRKAGPYFLFALLLLVDSTVCLLGEGFALTWRLPFFVALLTLRAFLVLVALAFLTRRFGRGLMPILFVWIFFVEFIEVCAYLHFGLAIRGEIGPILLGSSRAEVGAFFARYLTGRVMCAIGAGFVVLALGVWALLRHPCAYPASRGKSFGFGAGLLLVACLMGFTLDRPLFTGFVFDSVTQFARYRNVARAIKEPDLSDVTLLGRRVPVAVFVIGESATRDHWGLYGYARETTPRLAARTDDLVVLSDILSPWSQTQVVLQMLLTRATLDDPDVVVATFPQVLARAGYRCVLVSAQGHWGVFDTIDTLLFAGASRAVYVTEADPPIEGHDERVLPFVREELKRSSATNQPLVLFVHLYGSHSCAYADRYPAAASVFSAEERRAGALEPDGVNAYDDSIRYTDALLDVLIGFLEADGREAVFFYLSDHGETPDAGENRVFGDPSLWRVPCVFWASRAYRAAHPGRIKALERIKDSPLQSDRLYDGLLELLNIRLKGREKESFLSESFDLGLPRRVRNGSKEVPPRW